ncbi:MAG: winged helix-turn-helix transcriptional regulator [Syntrophaceae bacterium]|nr:winged helix-turn-helix transcriptional regulator [Syntrophaceae bacterium]
MDNQLVKTFKALGDQNRLNILAMLLHEPLFVCEISQMLHLAFSTTSQHLTILRNAGFIIDTKEGRWVKCDIDYQSSNPYAQSLLNLLKQWLDKEVSFKQGIELLLTKRPEKTC